MTVTPSFVLPQPLATLLSGLPAYPGSMLLVTALNLGLARQLPGDVRQFLLDKKLRIHVRDARLLVLHAAWLLDQGDAAHAAATRAQIAAIKVVAARLQTRVVDRAMQVFGAMGLSPDTPLAQFWTWGRALHLMDGPDEVHLRSVARHELAQARTRMGASSAWFTTPEQLQAPPRIRS